ncbi:ankyrin repeat domain-containing protein [Sphingosinithalassobacter sp. LHW66-3]|uniref:ankyrin repeat domain-containing protein n=1 Tax=Sphingosinithalassobacter sp. LHW66-3 TaxID=3424718 RepID=UPI003D6BA9BE
MFRKLVRVAAAAVALAFVATPAAAQNFSDGYKFLKAIRDADGTEVMNFLNTPGQRIVNARDQTTGEAALHIVAKRKDLTYLRFLLQRGANPDIRDSDGNSPMMLSANLRWLEGIEALIAKGADVNLANTRGETPLIVAVQREDYQLVRTLLDAGADPDRPDLLAGLSAREYAARDVRSQSIRNLLEAAPRIERANVSGPTLR